MAACRLFFGLMVVVGAWPLCRAAPPAAGGAADSNADPEAVARWHFENKRYREALETYTRWNPQQRSCGIGRFTLNGRRMERIAVCQAHLGDHAGAARTCLESLFRTDCYRSPDIFLLQLYREAGQLGDLAVLLDAVEKVHLDKQPKAWLLTPAARAALLDSLRTGAVRELLQAATRGELDPWPNGVPKPKPGSLPKALSK